MSDMTPSNCPACGLSAARCPDHHENTDPGGFARLLAHDEGVDHSDCHPYGCPVALQIYAAGIAWDIYEGDDWPEDLPEMVVTAVQLELPRCGD